MFQSSSYGSQESGKLHILLKLSVKIQLIPPFSSPWFCCMWPWDGFLTSKAQFPQEKNGVHNCTCLTEFCEDDMKAITFISRALGPEELLTLAEYYSHFFCSSFSASGSKGPRATSCAYVLSQNLPWCLYRSPHQSHFRSA